MRTVSQTSACSRLVSFIITLKSSHLLDDLTLSFQSLIFITEFAYGKVDPVEAGKQGGHTSGSSDGDNYKPTENDGLTKDGSVDGRTKAGGNTEFAHGKVDPVEAGKKGGQTS